MNRMHVSLNELDGLVRKAARGAGLAWGQAEEAGKGAWHLAALGHDPTPALTDLLETHDRAGLATGIDAEGAVWRAADGRDLSALLAGPALSDFAFALGRGTTLTLLRLLYPVLLLPFLMWVARDLNRPVTLRAGNARWTVNPVGGLSVALSELAAIQGPLTVQAGPARDSAEPQGSLPAGEPASCWPGLEVDPAVWARLERLAARTYVPASEQSRARGAGSGQTVEND